LNAGLALMVPLSLLSIGLLQTWASGASWEAPRQTCRLA